MSRSYKKNSYHTEGYKKDRSWRKRLANKRVKNSLDIADGSAYKRESQSWDICDWKFHSNDPKAKRK